MAYDTGPTRSTKAHTAKGKVTAKTASAKLLGASVSGELRVSAYISNCGANAVWLCLGEEAAVAEEGPMLTKEGGSVVIPDYAGEIRVITKTGESVVSYAVV